MAERSEAIKTDEFANCDDRIVQLFVFAALGGFLLLIFLTMNVPPVAPSQETTLLGQFRELKLSEKGDALAGIFGSLAFIAAVAALFYQRNELLLTRKEFEKMAVAQADQAIALKEQVDALRANRDFFEDEQRRRNEVRARELLAERLDGIISLLTSNLSISAFWAQENSADLYRVFEIGDPDGKDESAAEVFSQAAQRMDQYCRSVMYYNNASGKIQYHGSNAQGILRLKEMLASLLQSKSTLSNADQQRIENLGIAQFQASLEGFLSQLEDIE